jgi:methylase of polypeptide subunit release factors
LDGGKDGLNVFRELASQILKTPVVKKGGHLLVEVGQSQHRAVKKLLETTGLKWKKTLFDLEGIERCLVFECAT